MSNNAKASDPTAPHPTAPDTPPQPTTTAPHQPTAQKLNEIDFLAAEADQARHGIDETLDSMRDTLKSMTDLKAWTRAYPWATVGAAAATGFLAAFALFPKRSPQQAPAQDPSLLEKILADETIAARLKEIVEHDELPPLSGTSSRLQTAGLALWNTLAPTLQAALRDALLNRVSQPGDMPNSESYAAEPQAFAEDPRPEASRTEAPQHDESPTDETPSDSSLSDDPNHPRP